MKVHHRNNRIASSSNDQPESHGNKRSNNVNLRKYSLVTYKLRVCTVRKRFLNAHEPN